MTLAMLVKYIFTITEYCELKKKQLIRLFAYVLEIIAYVRVSIWMLRMSIIIRLLKL